MIIGANSFQNPAILKAKEMGLETHVFAWTEGSIGERTADYFYPISIVEKEQILEKCREIKPVAVLTIASDLANITAQYVAEHLGLPCNSTRSILITSNKYEMRKALKTAGIATPQFCLVDNIEGYEQRIKELSFPLIVKPVDRSGSRSVTKVECVAEVKDAVQNAIEQSFCKQAIIEEWIDGEEYSCECISYEGKHQFLALTKKFTTGSPNFIETGHIEPAKLDCDVYQRVIQHIFSALNALEIRMGASHSEFKIDRDGIPHIIEIGARMGGDCIGSHLVKLSTGYDFVQMVIEVAMGKLPSFVKVNEPSTAAIKFLFNEGDFQALERIKKTCSDSLVYISELEKMDGHKVTDSSTRYGYYILSNNEYEKVVRMMKI